MGDEEDELEEEVKGKRKFDSIEEEEEEVDQEENFDQEVETIVLNSDNLVNQEEISDDKHLSVEYEIKNWNKRYLDTIMEISDKQLSTIMDTSEEESMEG